MVMFIPCRLKIINRLFSRVCFYFHLCPVITVESHSGRPSPKKTKSHLTFHKHQPNFTSQKIEQKQPKILPSSTCSAVPICQKFWFNQPTQQSQHQTSPALKQKSPTSRGVTFSQWRIINPTVTTSIDKPNQTNQKIPGQDFPFNIPRNSSKENVLVDPKKLPSEWHLLKTNYNYYPNDNQHKTNCPLPLVANSTNCSNQVTQQLPIVPRSFGSANATDAPSHGTSMRGSMDHWMVQQKWPREIPFINLPWEPTTFIFWGYNPYFGV